MTQATDKEKKAKIIVKVPSQDRSRQTVATILEACSKLLVTEGFYEITTDRIAKEANVSIGSLYQFFGNKESVVQAVVKNIMEEDKRLITEGMKGVALLSPHLRFQAMIKLTMDTVGRNAELRSKLTAIQFYVVEDAYASEFLGFFQEVIKSNIPKIAQRDLDTISYVIVHAFFGLINSICFDNHKAINTSEIVSEILLLFTNYLNIEPSKAV